MNTHHELEKHRISGYWGAFFVMSVWNPYIGVALLFFNYFYYESEFKKLKDAEAKQDEK